MIVRFKSDLLIVSAESEDERESLVCWSEDLEGYIFILKRQDEQTFRFISAGPEAEARREPINVTSRSLPPLHLISNFAHTPFVLEGRRYASVEAFWQGLKYPDEKRRKEIAPLYGKEAMRAGADAPDNDVIEYGSKNFRVGTYEHWRLMTMACRAKFSQHEEARNALLETGDRPLTHITRKDSRTIPGVIMAEIWTRIRNRLRHPKTLHDELYGADWDGDPAEIPLVGDSPIHKDENIE